VRQDRAGRAVLQPRRFAFALGAQDGRRTIQRHKRRISRGDSPRIALKELDGFARSSNPPHGHPYDKAARPKVPRAARGQSLKGAIWRGS
jgi:hypothetical protein